MLLTYCVILYSLAPSTTWANKGLRRGKVAVVGELSNCPTAGRLPGKLSDIKLENAGAGNVSLSFVLEFERVIHTLSKIVFTLNKCRSRAEPESCEFFMKFPVKNGCEVMTAKNQVWTPFFQNSDRPYVCPLSGRYKVGNLRFEPTTFLSFMPGVEGPYWKLQTDFYGKREHVLCFIAGCQIMTVKRKI